jgi:hypothetical protein
MLSGIHTPRIPLSWGSCVGLDDLSRQLICRSLSDRTPRPSFDKAPSCSKGTTADSTNYHVVNLIPGVVCGGPALSSLLFRWNPSESFFQRYLLAVRSIRSLSSSEQQQQQHTERTGGGEPTLPVDILETATNRPGESRSTCQSTVTSLRRNLYSSTKPDLFTRPTQPSPRGRISTYSLITTRYPNTRARGALPSLHALDEWDSGEEKRCVWFRFYRLEIKFSMGTTRKGRARRVVGH